jgi:tetratricopeptide (TPR) repeat protein
MRVRDLTRAPAKERAVYQALGRGCAAFAEPESKGIQQALKELMGAVELARTGVSDSVSADAAYQLASLLYSDLWRWNEALPWAREAVKGYERSGASTRESLRECSKG